MRDQEYAMRMYLALHIDVDRFLELNKDGPDEALYEFIRITRSVRNSVDGDVARLNRLAQVTVLRHLRQRRDKKGKK